jgi:hypothetical protein
MLVMFRTVEKEHLMYISGNNTCFIADILLYIFGSYPKAVYELQLNSIP